MIQDVGNIELCELLVTEPKNAVQSVPIILEYQYGLLHVRAFLAQRNRGQSEIRQIYDGTFFQSPEYVIKKGSLHRHRYGKKPEGQIKLSG